jgi:hypothetical protein
LLKNEASAGKTRRERPRERNVWSVHEHLEAFRNAVLASAVSTNPSRQPVHRLATGTNLNLWWRWVLANAFGEVVGLGLVGIVGWLAMGAIGERQTAGLVLAFAALAVALGAVEGTGGGLGAIGRHRQAANGV